jgi:arylsulfatase A-like enzyme
MLVAFGFLIVSNWMSEEYRYFITPEASVRAHERPDVYFLVVDTLRADHTTIHGYSRPTTSALERFGQEAYVFEDVISPSSWTLPAVGSLMTSLYPSVHGLEGRSGKNTVLELRSGALTIAEHMRDSGYRTVAIITNPWVGPESGLLRGFEEVVMGSWKDAAFVHRVAKSKLAQSDPRPLFLYMHYMDVHGPFNAPDLGPGVLGALPEIYVREMTTGEIESVPDYLRKEGVTNLGVYVDAYDRGIYLWDVEFGDWIDWLKKQGIFEHAIISLISDHGEEFLEHGGWNHGETLYQEQIHVPWLVRTPKGHGKRINNGRITSLDVTPTLLQLVGIPVPSEIQGIGQLPILVESSNRTVFSETVVALGGVYNDDLRKTASIQRQFKLIVDVDHHMSFDLNSDPLEESPRTDIPFCNSELRSLTDAWQAANEVLANKMGIARKVTIDQQTMENLRKLGYAE